MLPRLARRNWKFLGISALLLLPIVAAVLSPLLAPIPARAQGWTVSLLPERDELLPDFQDLLEPLPLLVRDLPDGASQQVVAVYDAATLGDSLSSRNLLEAAKEAVPVPPDLTRAWDQWLDRMADTEEWSVSAPIPDEILLVLAADPLNADRLGNLAVAIYLTELTVGFRPDQPRLSPTTGPIVSRVIVLLQSIRDTFPENRGATLNFVALLKVHSRQNAILDGIDDDVEVLEAWLDGHPDDSTALMLYLQVYQRSLLNAPSAEEAKGAIERFAEGADGLRSALALALLGDLGQIEAAALAEVAPFASTQKLREALSLYDQALALSDDATLYFARAAILEKLGEIPAAIESQRRAVELAPTSVPARLRLSQLYFERRGSESDILESAQIVRTISQEALDATDDGRDIPLSHLEIRVVVSSLDSFVMMRPDRYFVPLGPWWGGAGGEIVTFDEIPVHEGAPWVLNSEILEPWSPAVWAIHHFIFASILLGHPDGVEDVLTSLQPANDIDRWIATQDNAEMLREFPIQRIAQLLADQASIPPNEFDANDAETAISVLRYAGLNQRAVSLCESLLDRADINVQLMEVARTCVAENADLAGDYATSQHAFEALRRELMIGYAAERQGHIDEASRHYQLAIAEHTPESYLAMLRLANMTLNSDPRAAIVAYDQVLEWERDTNGCSGSWCVSLESNLPIVYNNRGIAQLRLLAYNHGAIDCDGDAWEVCTSALMDFDTALDADPANPYFLMNKAWAARLLGDMNLSKQVMVQAVESGMAPFPILNDLGVFASEAGDSNAAKQYFQNAVAVNPHYDLALWNLGVLHMRDGLGGLVRGQAYLARAIVQNPDLLSASLQLLTDESIYRIEITERSGAGTGWSIGPAATVATAFFGLLAVVPVIFSTLKDQVANRYLDEFNRWLDTWNQGLLRQRSDQLPPYLNRHWVPHLFGVTVLVLATALLALRDGTSAAFDLMIIALFAAMLAVVVHELGHILAARRWRATIQNDQWGTGSLISLGFLAGGAGAGPFPAHRIQAEKEHDAAKVYLAGPIANLLVALVVYFAFIAIEPLPAYQLIAQTQIAAMAFALMPFAPLDGAAISRSSRGVLGILAAFLAVVFGLGWGVS